MPKFDSAVRVLRRTAGEALFNLSTAEPHKAWHAVKSTAKFLLFDHPWNIQVEPANMCNLRCEFCSAPPWELTRDKAFLSLDDWQKMIDDIQHATHYIWLWFAGEPFMNKHAPEMIHYATKRGLHVITSSNVMLLNQDVANRVIDAGLDELICSIDGASKESSEAMRIGSKFETVIENIRYLIQERNRRGKKKPVVILQLIVSAKNAHETNAFKQLGRELGADRVELKSLGLPTWIYEEAHINKLKDEYFPKNTDKVRYDNDWDVVQKSCGFDRKTVIHVNGDVSLCCYDINGKYTFGNVFEKPFLDIWRSAHRHQVRDAIGTLDLCQLCGASAKTYLK